MNTNMFLQTMINVLKFDSKFKEEKGSLLPILRRAQINNLPQYEFVRLYGKGRKIK